TVGDFAAAEGCVGFGDHASDVDFEFGARGQKQGKDGAEQQKQRAVKDGAGANDASFGAAQKVFACVADQASGFVHADHDDVASIDALCATDAFHLQTVSDVDTDRAGANAGAAVDAVAQIQND